MISLKQIYFSMKYHKKLTIAFFVIFTVLLFMLILIYQLRFVQLNSNQILEDKWAFLNELSESTKQNIQHTLAQNNIALLKFYNRILFFLIILSFMSIFFLGYFIANTRKSEIIYMLNSGVAKVKIIGYFIFETLVSSIVSFLILTFLICLLQAPFIKGTVKINQFFNTYQISKQHLIIEQMIDTENEQPILENREIKISNKKSALLPYNEDTIFLNQMSDHSFRETLNNIFHQYSLLLIICIWSLTLGIASYLLIHKDTGSV
ncbi:hypothetical protein ACWOAH_01125 [Vagococcus vulneris]|uniref:ABC3 transporter permease protein domain-containing protein n=1 Tax=Vagococcus vulneris TaxID=1977869 RepID=A0A430A239_9ENTE|nr:hypothetical protein [Vagococcus vulneris]RSU00511.1 hypothetical protein CBF37_00415 [Vagococcus vulneris]